MAIYSIDIKLCATAYIRASSAEEARNILKQHIGETEGIEGEDDVRDIVDDSRFDGPNIPEFSISPAVTYYGPWSDNIDHVYLDQVS